ncbi:uncharacterized protein LOC134824412 [Bolinopsis microptera]|uniref:uncharacterized protein LOC134824412 n=1 Tax=Bolinopsis microptera TaxID=2820187 RepID=UPI003079810D
MKYLYLIAKVMSVLALLHTPSAQYSRGSAEWVPDTNTPPLKCEDLRNQTLPVNKIIDPEQGDILQFKYELPLSRYSEVSDCFENLELGVSHGAPYLLNFWNWVKIKIDGAEDLKLTLINGTGRESESKQRDKIRFSDDSIISMYLELHYVVKDTSLTYTLKFLSNTTIQLNVTAWYTRNPTLWEEQSLTLEVPNLNRTAGVRFRSLSEQTITEDWDRECMERPQLKQICYGNSGEVVEKKKVKKKKGPGVWVIVTIIALVVVGVVVLVVLHRIGHLKGVDTFRQWTQKQYNIILNNSDS